MIHVLFGGDSYSIKEALGELRSALGPQDIWDANTTVLQAHEATPSLLVGLCATVPFLAERRLVIVEGLLASVEGQGRRARAEGAGRRAEASEQENGATGRRQWRGLAEAFKDLPPTTDLVFLEGPLRRNNALFRELVPLAQVREFPPLRGADLRSWILRRVALRGTAISPRAVQLLVELVGPDLWTQGNEIEKLSLYCDRRRIEEEDVRLLVSPAREASIFAAIDAVLEGNAPVAMRLISRLLEGGAAVTYILGMLSRQIRLVLLTQELLRDQVKVQEAGRRLGIASEYPLQKTLEQARQSDPGRLRLFHNALLETDISIKTGTLEERLALELLVARLCLELRA